MPSIINALTASGGGVAITGDATGNLALQTAGNTAVTVTTAQLVGVGTTTPSAKLHVSQVGNPVAQFTRSDSGTGLVIASDSDGPYFRPETSSAIRFNNAANTVENMRITSGGNLLINTTTNSSDRVQIYENNAAYNSLYLNSSSNTGTQYYISFLRQGTQAGYLTSNSSTTVQLNNSSDVRLKENITDANSAIPSIMSAKVRQFDWKENISPHQDFGFVAQELVDVIPEAVTVGIDNEDGTIKMPWGIDYSHIVPRLVKAIQELKAELDATKAEVQALKGVK